MFYLILIDISDTKVTSWVYFELECVPSVDVLLTRRGGSSAYIEIFSIESRFIEKNLLFLRLDTNSNWVIIF